VVQADQRKAATQDSEGIFLIGLVLYVLLTPVMILMDVFGADP
jgi:hypothetical protein